MDRTKDVPEWAIKHALERCGVSRDDFYEWAASSEPSRIVRKYAHYIAEHEKAPVDPIEEEAQAIADQFGINLSAYAPRINDALQAALRRGIELDKEQQP